MILGDLSIFVARGDLAGNGVDQHVERFRKRGSVLDVMIADELKNFALRKDCGLVVKGTVAKVKGKAGCGAIPMKNLNKIANGEGIALRQLKYKEAMERSLGAANRNGISGHRLRSRKARCKDEQDLAQTVEGRD